MLGDLEGVKKYGSLITLVVGFIFIAISGVLMGFIHYTMSVVQTGFENTNCVIDNNLLVSNCQELWSLALFPLLNLKDLLIWFSFFSIFAMVLGMLLFGYQSGKSPVMMGLLVAFIIGLTYLGIEVSNLYRGMIENDLFRSVMTDFTVYNKIMLNFPWFCFFVGLFAIVLGLVNYQKVKVNKDDEELNY